MKVNDDLLFRYIKKHYGFYLKESKLVLDCLKEIIKENYEKNEDTTIGIGRLTTKKYRYKDETKVIPILKFYPKFKQKIKEVERKY